MDKLKSLFRFITIATLFLSACTSPRIPSTNSVNATVTSGYPGPKSDTNTQGYPAPNNSAYPAPNKSPSIKPTAFRLQKPLREGDTKISGVGPANIPIIIADVTFNGKELATGTIGSDGTFTITLPDPLEKNHRIGIALGNLKGTQWENELFSDPGFFGDEYQQVPMVGFFYDTAMVQPK